MDASASPGFSNSTWPNSGGTVFDKVAAQFDRLTVLPAQPLRFKCLQFLFNLIRLASTLLDNFARERGLVIFRNANQHGIGDAFESVMWEPSLLPQSCDALCPGCNWLWSWLVLLSLISQFMLLPVRCIKERDGNSEAKSHQGDSIYCLILNNCMKKSRNSSL